MLTTNTRSDLYPNVLLTSSRYAIISDSQLHSWSLSHHQLYHHKSFIPAGLSKLLWLQSTCITCSDVERSKESSHDATFCNITSQWVVVPTTNVSNCKPVGSHYGKLALVILHYNIMTTLRWPSSPWPVMFNNDFVFLIIIKVLIVNVLIQYNIPWEINVAIGYQYSL